VAASVNSHHALRHRAYRGCVGGSAAVGWAPRRRPGL